MIVYIREPTEFHHLSFFLAAPPKILCSRMEGTSIVIVVRSKRVPVGAGTITEPHRKRKQKVLRYLRQVISVSCLNRVFEVGSKRRTF